MARKFSKDSSRERDTDDTPAVSRSQYILPRRKSWDAGCSVSPQPLIGEDGPGPNRKLLRRRASANLVETTSLRGLPALPSDDEEPAQGRATFSAGDAIPATSLWEPRSSVRRRNLAQQLGVLGSPDSVLSSPRSASKESIASDISTAYSSNQPLEASYSRPTAKSKADDILAKLNAVKKEQSVAPVPLECEVRRLSRTEMLDSTTKRIEEKIARIQTQAENHLQKDLQKEPRVDLLLQDVTS
eukprot:gnl/MRDRNA2_/MRDRNA2_157609_c0_seq1.p1 gnl/MRDRNA2_/MRDRNA2_157609_c0~~gnl/MRDRNA2_/MRDRNA2_157609_c0_seq1.p1  ORF type:complete len:243 (+),score=50.66 gnl/MRDRNA2_/MRDRNA2_157609_c0_seq1:136-864(+)